MSDKYIIESLGYVRIGMRDPAQWAQLGESVLGFQAHTYGKGAVYLRMDSAPVRFIVEPAEQDGFICAAWECTSEHYKALVAKLAKQGVALAFGTAEDCTARSVDAFVTGLDPSGNRFEIFHGRGSADSAFRSPIDGTAFVADALGLGHAILPASDIDATTDFYLEVMGFGMSDALTLPPPAAYAHGHAALYFSDDLDDAAGLIHLQLGNLYSCPQMSPVLLFVGTKLSQSNCSPS